VKPRYLAIGAAVWAAGYAGIYIVIVRGQGNSPAWWYVALLAAGAILLAFSAGGRHSRQTLILGTGVLGVAALIGVLSVGLLLVPGVVAAAIAAASPAWHSDACGPTS
jgi:hypothetical protein